MAYIRRIILQYIHTSVKNGVFPSPRLLTYLYHLCYNQNIERDLSRVRADSGILPYMKRLHTVIRDEKNRLREAVARRDYLASLTLSRPMPRQVHNFLVAYFTMAKGDKIKAVQIARPDVVSLDEQQKIAASLMRHKDVRQVLKTYAVRAADRVETLAETARSEKVRLDANLGILDRAGYAVPKEQHTNNTLIIQIPEAIARKNGIAPTVVGGE